MLWGRVDKYVLWKAEEKWKAKGWGLTLQGACAAVYDVGGHLLAILRRQGEVYVHGE